MAPETAHGRRGNLTPEEGVKLKALWIALFDLFKIEHQQHENQSSRPASLVQATSKKKWSLFGGKAQAEVIAGNEPLRWSKDYQDALASYTPEQLHEGFWQMPRLEHPDDLLLRFLRARKWDVEAALMMFVPAVTWINYELHVYDDLVLRGDSDSAGSSDPKGQQDFINQLRMGKAFMHGCDKDGRPVLYIRARLHYQAEQTNLTMTRFIIYMIETIRLMMPPEVDTGTIVFDLSESSMKNMDFGPVRFIMTDQHFPETLGKVVLYKAPWFMAGIWRTLRTWLDPEMAYKVNFATDVDELAQHIARDQIPRELGGEEDYTWAYIEGKEGENARMELKEERDRIVAARTDLIRSFEKETASWLHSDDDDGQRRNTIAEQLRRNYWELDPYVRARSVYDRLGMIQPSEEVKC